MSNRRKGFTLIELLVVIGILAILTTITVLVLNPAQLFAQARDSQRISDMGTLKGAIALYLTSVSGPDLALGTFDCSDELNTNYAASVNGTAGNSPFTTSVNELALYSEQFTTDGTGWISVNLDATTGGSPLSVLPRDPSNDATLGLFYAYACDNSSKTFELNTHMESDRYKNGGADDVENTDGGTNANFYEVGTDPGLNL